MKLYTLIMLTYANYVTTAYPKLLSANFSFHRAFRPSLKGQGWTLTYSPNGEEEILKLKHVFFFISFFFRSTSVSKHNFQVQTVNFVHNISGFFIRYVQQGFNKVVFQKVH